MYNFSIKYIRKYEMTKELEELEKRIKKERSKILKERMQEMFDHCCEVYENISIMELRLLWYIRQFSKYNAEYFMSIARGVYRDKLIIQRVIDEEAKIYIDKPEE